MDLDKFWWIAATVLKRASLFKYTERSQTEKIPRCLFILSKNKSVWETFNFFKSVSLACYARGIFCFVRTKRAIFLVTLIQDGLMTRSRLLYKQWFAIESFWILTLCLQSHAFRSSAWLLSCCRARGLSPRLSVSMYEMYQRKQCIVKENYVKRPAYTWEEIHGVCVKCSIRTVWHRNKKLS